MQSSHISVTSLDIVIVLSGTVKIRNGTYLQYVFWGQMRSELNSTARESKCCEVNPAQIIFPLRDKKRNLLASLSLRDLKRSLIPSFPVGQEEQQRVLLGKVTRFSSRQVT
jgi:hypothetical protein